MVIVQNATQKSSTQEQSTATITTPSVNQEEVQNSKWSHRCQS